MGMIVQHNMASMNANRNLGVVSGALSKSTEKLSSGYRINRAGDDAAGLAISEKMRGQIRGLDQASSNAEDGISLIQTAEGALTETHSILQRMRELAVQASSDTNTDDDRTQIQTEINQLTEEVDRIANTTEFNTKKLIDGSRTGAVVEKSGKISVEGTFSNSNVSASISNDGSAKQAYTDVIRVEIKEDFSNYGENAGALTATQAEVDAYKNLAEGIGNKKAEISTLISGTNGLTFTQAEVDAYVTATKNALKAGADSATAQTNAWDTIYGKIATTTAPIVIGGQTMATGALQPAVGAALKTALDSIAKDEIEMETNAKYQEMAAIEVDDVSNPGTKKDLETIMNDMVSKSSGYSSAIEQGSTTGILGANGANAAALKAAVDAYKDAYKTAAASGLTGDDALQNDVVVEARQAVYDLFETAFNKNAAGDTVTIPAGGLDIGDENFPAGNANIAQVAGAVFDNILDQAQDLALEEINQDNAFAKVDTSGAEPEKAYTITDLFGNGEGEPADKFSISSTMDNDKNLTITLKNGDDPREDTVITIKNADNLKAGDVITISSEKYTETQPAATGKDALRLQVGANAGQEVSLGINSMKASDLDIVQKKAGHEGAALNVTKQADASLAVNAYDMAIQRVSAERAKMGAVQNRLEHTISNLDTSAENLQTAESRIRDTDMAEEMTQYSKNNILMQAGQSMLAQANQSTQGVLSLLQ